jgi:hypothetical protein
MNKRTAPTNRTRKLEKLIRIKAYGRAARIAAIRAGEKRFRGAVSQRPPFVAFEHGGDVRQQIKLGELQVGSYGISIF